MKPLLITLLFVVVATFAGCKKKCIGNGQKGENDNRSYINFELLNPNGGNYFGFYGAGQDLSYVNMLDEKGNEVIGGEYEEPWRKDCLSYQDDTDPSKPTGISNLSVDFYNGYSAYKDSIGIEINRTFYLKLTKFDTDTIKVKYTLIDPCQKIISNVKIQYNNVTYLNEMGTRPGNPQLTFTKNP